MSIPAKPRVAAKFLPPQELQEVMRIHPMRLQAAKALPPPGGAPKEQIDQPIADNAVGYRVSVQKPLDGEY